MNGLILGCWLMPCCYRPCISYPSTAKCGWPLTGRLKRTSICWRSPLLWGRRAVPIYWRADDTSVLKGRTETLRTGGHPPCAVGRVAQAVGTRRVIVTADLGFCGRGPVYLTQPVGRHVHHPGASRHPRLVPGQVAQVGAIAISGQ